MPTQTEPTENAAIQSMHVWPDAEGSARGHLTWRRADGATGVLRCALGRSGLSEDKCEGDGATPIGTFHFVEGFWRADRLARINAALPMRPIHRLDGWSDDPADPDYNSYVRHPEHGTRTHSAEHLWREDVLYNLVLVIDHNQNPARPGKGSAIFVHVAKPGYPPTEGCIALAERDLLRLLPGIGPQTALIIDEGSQHTPD